MTTPAAAVAAGRRAAEALMVDACTITHGTGGSVQDETTGQVTRTTSTVYTGPCRVQLPQAQPRTADVAERTATLQRAIISLPVATSAGVRVGAMVTITAAALDGDLVARRFRVVGLHHKTYATARRLECEEAAG
jgi:hypothetical protein